MKMNTALIVIVLAAITLALFYVSQNQESSKIMDPQTAKQNIEEQAGIIIDVRTSEEFAGGHLQQAQHNFDVMSGEFASKLDSLDKDETYYLYCRTGNRSGKATKMMKQDGFSNVHNIGGYQDLVDAGFESEK